MVFDNYDLKLFENVQEMIDDIKTKDIEYGLSRVVAGYAWEWKSKKKPEANLHS